MIDHSVIADVFGRPDAFARNVEIEYGRNAERYRFMKWAANTVRGFRVFPPGTGIMHTINLERLSSVVATERRGVGSHPHRGFETVTIAGAENDLGRPILIPPLDTTSTARCRAPPPLPMRISAM